MPKKKTGDWVSRFAVFTLVALLAIWTAWFWFSPWWAKVVGIESAGLMGDSFGAINTLFTGFAMLGAVASLLYQQKTIRDQQAAQAEQQLEIAAQQMRFQQTHVEQLKARFEQTFFELLKLSRELRAKISFRNSQSYKTLTNIANARELQSGDAAFRAIKSEVMVLWSARVGSAIPVKDEHPVGAFYAAEVHRANEDQLGPYFRIIYSMLRRISEASFLTADEKVSYGNLLRSQLTSTELFVIGVNGLSHISGDFDQYLTEFRMFKYLPQEEKDAFLVTWAALQPTYDASAFEGRQGKDV